jgi:hypothetical protein
MIDAPATWALAEVVNNMSDPVARTTEPAVDRRGKLLRPTPSRTIQQLLATLLTLLPRLKSRELRVATAPWNGNGFINGDSFVLGGTFPVKNNCQTTDFENKGRFSFGAGLVPAQKAKAKPRARTKNGAGSKVYKPRILAC